MPADFSKLISKTRSLTVEFSPGAASGVGLGGAGGGQNNEYLPPVYKITNSTFLSRKTTPASKLNSFCECTRVDSATVWGDRRARIQSALPQTGTECQFPDT